MSWSTTWDQMSAAEKAEHVRDALEGFIAHQNAAKARMTTRIKALEEALAKTDKAQS
jgi:hypothetical protein